MGKKVISIPAIILSFNASVVTKSCQTLFEAPCRPDYNLPGYSDYQGCFLLNKDVGKSHLGLYEQDLPCGETKEFSLGLRKLTIKVKALVPLNFMDRMWSLQKIHSGFFLEHRISHLYNSLRGGALTISSDLKDQVMFLIFQKFSKKLKLSYLFLEDYTNYHLLISCTLHWENETTLMKADIQIFDWYLS